MTTHPIDTEALRKLADAATPGPWEYEWDEAEGEITVRAGTALVGEDGFAPGSYFTSDMIIEHDDAWPEDSGEQNAANAEFIAAARGAVPALLDENAALRARIKAVREALDGWDDIQPPAFHQLADEIRRALDGTDTPTDAG